MMIQLELKVPAFLVSGDGRKVGKIAGCFACRFPESEFFELFSSYGIIHTCWGSQWTERMKSDPLNLMRFIPT